MSLNEKKLLVTKYTMSWLMKVWWCDECRARNASSKQILKNFL